MWEYVGDMKNGYKLYYCYEEWFQLVLLSAIIKNG